MAALTAVATVALALMPATQSRLEKASHAPMFVFGVVVGLQVHGKERETVELDVEATLRGKASSRIKFENPRVDSYRENPYDPTVGALNLGSRYLVALDTANPGGSPEVIEWWPIERTSNGYMASIDSQSISLAELFRAVGIPPKRLPPLKAPELWNQRRPTCAACNFEKLLPSFRPKSIPECKRSVEGPGKTSFDIDAEVIGCVEKRHEQHLPFFGVIEPAGVDSSNKNAVLFDGTNYQMLSWGSDLWDCSAGIIRETCSAITTNGQWFECERTSMTVLCSQSDTLGQSIEPVSAVDHLYCKVFGTESFSDCGLKPMPDHQRIEVTDDVVCDSPYSRCTFKQR